MDREKVIKGLNDIQKHLDTGYSFAICWKSELIRDAIALLKEQEADMIALKNAYKELAEKGSVIVRCKDCDNRECDGRAGTIVCGITGESHSRLWFCADGERRDDDD